MNKWHFHDEIGRQLEPLGILTVCLQNNGQHLELLELGLPAELDANLGELDLIAIANHRVLVDSIAGVVDELAVPHAKVVTRLGSLSKDRDRRSNVALVGCVFQVIANRFEHSSRATTKITHQFRKKKTIVRFMRRRGVIKIVTLELWSRI